MFLAHGLKLRMTQGDFGIPISIHLKAHCESCGEQLFPTDVIRLVIERANTPLVTKEATWETVQACDGYFKFSLTEQETGGLDYGLYTWRACIVRESEVRNTLVTDTLEVVS